MAKINKYKQRPAVSSKTRTKSSVKKLDYSDGSRNYSTQKKLIQATYDEDVAEEEYNDTSDSPDGYENHE